MYGLDLLGFCLVDLIDLIAKIRDDSVVFLSQIGQNGLMLKGSIVVVVLEFGQLDFALAIQLDLGGRGVARLFQFFAQFLQLSTEDLSRFFSLSTVAALDFQLFL